MAVTEVIQGLGGWSAILKDAPAELIDALQYFGHVAIHTGRVDYRTMGDAALTSSRYTGVLRSKHLDDDTVTIGGPSMAMWLGDEDQKGDVYETEVNIVGLTFENTLRALLPTSGAVTEGTFFNIGQNFTGKFKFMSPRQAVDYVTSTLNAEWRMRGDGKLDAGLESDLFVTNPKTIVARRESGVDMDLRGFLGNADTDQDVEDFTTRVVLLANTTDQGPVATGDADINPGINPYKDVHGNTVKMTRLVQETATDTTNAAARAQLQLNRFSDTRDSMKLNSSEYDIKGDLSVGDYMWVHDPEINLVDGNNQVIFRGKRLNPMKLRLTEMTWPLQGKFSVGFRDWAGKWWNLTDYVQPESGSTTLVVGGYSRSLTNGGANGGIGGTAPTPNTTIPDVPTWVTPFLQSVYQSPVDGNTKAQVELHWTRPNNTDASTITDGDHYEIRYRSSATPVFPVTWAQLAGLTWGQIQASGGTWDNPIVYPVGNWQYLYAPWTELTFLLQDLAPNMPYEAEIRAVDGAVPSNYGAWSTTAVFQTHSDTIPPSTPAPPSVAASTLAIQLTHTLGVAAGGTYNLDADLHHFDVYGEYEPNFTPSDATFIGKLIANNGMILAHTPAVGSFNINNLFPTYFKVVAVDNDGNRSNSSVAVQTTALLVDDAHITNLTVSKVTAGTITADWLVGARIATAFTGNRVEMNPTGIELWDNAGVKTASLDASTGNFDSIGSIKSGVTGQRVEVNPRAGFPIPEIRLYPNTGSSFALINSVSPGSSVANLGANSGTPDGVVQSTMYLTGTSAFLGRCTVNGPSPSRGGTFFADDNQALMSYDKSPVQAWVRVFSDRTIEMKGLMNLGNSIGADVAHIWYHVDGAAFLIVAMSFGATLINGVNIVGSYCKIGGDGDVSSLLGNLSQTGFTFSTDATGPTGSGRYSWIAYQTP